MLLEHCLLTRQLNMGKLFLFFGRLTLCNGSMPVSRPQILQPTNVPRSIGSMVSVWRRLNATVRMPEYSAAGRSLDADNTENEGHENQW